MPETIEESVSQLRKDIKEIAKRSKNISDWLKDQGNILILPESGDRWEAIANAVLAYRHLEDSAMRLGKVLQALDGWVSVYDR